MPNNRAHRHASQAVLYPVDPRRYHHAIARLLYNVTTSRIRFSLPLLRQDVSRAACLLDSSRAKLRTSVLRPRACAVQPPWPRHPPSIMEPLTTVTAGPGRATRHLAANASIATKSSIHETTALIAGARPSPHANSPSWAKFQSSSLPSLPSELNKRLVGQTR